MRRSVPFVVVLTAAALLGAGVPLAAQSPAESSLVVGVKDAPPFAIRNADGSWSGISIELWEKVAERRGYRFDYVETDLSGLLDGVATGAFDVGVAAITVTPDREQVMDFSHPFHVSGLGIATRKAARRGWMTVAERLLSYDFLVLILGLVGLLFAVGLLVWLFERRRNAEQFGGSAASGLGAGFWWSAVTMTTVGYGDKSPATLGGRIVALLWMFAALVLISTFTASIAALLTVGSLEGMLSGPGDLPGLRVGTVPASTSAGYLGRQGLPFRAFESPEAALRALDDTQVDAVVYDEPILRYLVRRQFGSTLTVLSATVDPQPYAFALPSRSALREPINVALLEETVSPDWTRLLGSYIGESD